MFLVIIALIVVGNIAWWRWAHRRVRALPHAPVWKIAVGIFGTFHLGFILLLLIAPVYARHPHPWLPMPVLAFTYIWNLLLLPAVLIIVGATALMRWMKSLRRKPIDSGDSALSRRQWLSAVAVTVPPIIAIGITARALSQLGELRVRRFDLPIANLPPALDGLTIAQVTDTHIGHFTRTGALQRIIETTNQLRADLIVFTGDLIDVSLSDFPAGVDLIHRLDPKLGMVMIEGNHDLIEDPDEFELRARFANLPILFDETRTMDIRGEPVQFMGIRWGNVSDGPRRKSNNAVIRDSVARVLKQRDPAAFPILLAHHPHAFDAAGDAQIPLILSGHTHGGQLMLTERLGAGPVMFRYWSGLYRRGNSSLIVSNGAGNWFPLRINAPAEIIHLTLRNSV